VIKTRDGKPGLWCRYRGDARIVSREVCKWHREAHRMDEGRSTDCGKCEVFLDAKMQGG